VPDAFQLFPETFLTDITEFANAGPFDKSVSCLAEDAFEAGKICTALQHSALGSQYISRTMDSRSSMMLYLSFSLFLKIYYAVLSLSFFSYF
jgi:hypothetical protein